MALEQHLADLSALETETQSAIIDSLWPRQSNVDLEDYSHLNWTPYFTYYLNQCRHSLEGQLIATRTHQDIVKISCLLRRNSPRDVIETQLQTALKNAQHRRGTVIDKEDNISQKVNNTIDLVTRIYLMINVGVSEATFTTGRSKLRWIDDTPSAFLHRLFQPSKSLNDIGVRFEKSFTAQNIERIAGITIQWTDNLADHLRMLDAEDKIVAVFHYALFLKHQAAPVSPPFFPSLYPPGFIEETLRTLALLFPPHDTDLKAWLQSQSRLNNHRIDEQLLKLDHIRLEDRQTKNFHFWHDRLVILKQAYDESRPATLSQWWLDRRNTVQWYTFWVALVILLLTVFFGLIQVYKAYHPTVIDKEIL